MAFDWTPHTQTDQVPIFNTLFPTEILYELDREPLLYVSKTFHGLDVLCYKTDGDDIHSQYIVSPTSGDIINRLANGNMSLRSAIFQPWLWIAEVANDGFGVRSTWTINPQSLPETILPKAGRGLYKSGNIIEKNAYLMCMTPEQSRAARGWLGWSQQHLAERAHVGMSAVHNFEAGRRRPIQNNIDAMRRVLESSGIILMFDAEGRATGIAVTNAGALIGTSEP